MADMLDVSRVEEKYILTKLQALMLIAKMKQMLPGDPVNGYNEYIVRSMYFDSYYNEDYMDKLDGIFYRKKIRMRIYKEDAEKVKLELKQKAGSNQRKQSITITRQQAIQMQNGDYSFLEAMEDETAKAIYNICKKEMYRPKCIVQYTRQAFAVPMNNVRITFDSEVLSTESKMNLFSIGKEGMYPVMSQNQVVLEVKYNHFLPSYVKDILAFVDEPMGSYSKYVAGRYHGLN